MIFLNQWLDDFINLIYPKICAACGKKLISQEECICTRCLFHLPKTDYHLRVDNPVARIFWGRVPLEYATSFYEFEKGNRLQKLLHKMKYHNQKEIGWVLGKHFGALLNQSPLGISTDILVPVPLHPNKEKKRGYNQATWIAWGIAESMNKKIITDNLYRTVNTPTQTQKGRYERWKNVENNFNLNSPHQFNNQHILLVDDVVTTGATIEACAHALLKANHVKISVATLAFA